MYKGKSYKFKKVNNVLNLFLNKSHENIKIFNKIYIKKLHKTKMILFYFSTNYFKRMSFNLLNLRLNNIFTKRGLRLKRFIIYKKKGKSIL